MVRSCLWICTRVISERIRRGPLAGFGRTADRLAGGDHQTCRGGSRRGRAALAFPGATPDWGRTRLVPRRGRRGQVAATTRTVATTRESTSATWGARAGGDWPARYLALIKRAVGEVDIPVIASLNGGLTGAGTDYVLAQTCRAARVSAIELQVYYLPGDPLIPARDAERRYTEILSTVKAVASILVAGELSPYFSSFGEMAIVLDQAGADGLVLFNRFLQTDIYLKMFTVSPGFPALGPGSVGAVARLDNRAARTAWSAARWRRRPAWTRPPTWRPTCWAARTW